MFNDGVYFKIVFSVAQRQNSIRWKNFLGLMASPTMAERYNLWNSKKSYG